MPAQLSPDEAAGYLDLMNGMAQTVQDSSDRVLSGLRELAQLQAAPTVVQERPSDFFVCTTSTWSDEDDFHEMFVPASPDRLRITIQVVGGAMLISPAPNQPLLTAGVSDPNVLVVPSGGAGIFTYQFASRAAFYIKPQQGSSSLDNVVSVVQEFTQPQPGEVGHRHYTGCGCSQ